MFRRRME